MKFENIKTLIIFLLLTLSMFFIIDIMDVDLLRSFNNKDLEEDIASVDIEELRGRFINPSIIISLGISNPYNTYTVKEEDNEILWSFSKEVLRDYFTEDVKIENISKEYYYTNRRQKSIECDFPFEINALLMSSIFGMYDNNIIGEIKEIKKILIPENEEHIYIYSGKDYFKLTLEEVNKRNNIERYINDLRESGDYTSFYPIFSSIESVNNSVLVPLSIDRTFANFFISSVPYTDDNINNFASSFFDGNLDFVKSFEETSGAKVYFSSYGKKDLRISSMGEIVYNQEVSRISSNNIVESFDGAILFLEDVFSDELLNNIYLVEVEEIEDLGFRGFDFYFNYKIDSINVNSNGYIEKYPIKIRVFGSEVEKLSFFKRQKMDLPSVFPSRRIIEPPRILEIEENIAVIKEDIKSDEEYYQDFINSELSIEHYIIKNIDYISLVYYDEFIDPEMDILKPKWLFIINEKEYYFNIYTGFISDDK